MAKETRQLGRGIAGLVGVTVVLLLVGCHPTEDRLRKTLATQVTGIIQLPAGVIEISSELRLAPGAHDLEIVGSGTTLKATDEFHGRAILVGEDVRNITLRDFGMDGDRVAVEKPLDMVPPENAFRVYYRDNGVLFDRAEGLVIRDVRFGAIANFPILASRCSRIRIQRVTVEDCGSRDPRHRNNTTGGILLEEGARDFEVRDCTFRRVRGNALWTHSLYTSPRSEDGRFLANKFDSVGRDAIQVGHATRVLVEGNHGVRIGFPSDAVDTEHSGTPVGIDTSGDVDHSDYVRNTFEEVNGKCIDLDGFHDGSIRENRCTNRKRPEDYPFGHFAMVMNNTNPNMHSQNVEIVGNVIDGMKFGGLFLMGSGHRVTGNVFRNLNTAECNESAAKFGCLYNKDEPALLETGIYLSRGVVRKEETRGNVIQRNQISGHKMRSRCLAVGPGVVLAQNTVQNNDCTDSDRAR